MKKVKQLRKSTHELLADFYYHFYDENFDKEILLNRHFADILGIFMKEYKAFINEKKFQTALKKIIAGKDKYRGFLEDFTYNFDRETKTLKISCGKITPVRLTFAPDKIDFNIFMLTDGYKCESYTHFEGSILSSGSNIKRTEKFKLKKSHPLYYATREEKLYGLGLNNLVKYLNKDEEIPLNDLLQLPLFKYSRLACGIVRNNSFGTFPDFYFYLRGKDAKSHELIAADIGDGNLFIHNYYCPENIAILNTINGEPDNALFMPTEEQIKQYDEEDKAEKFRLYDPIYGAEAEVTTETKEEKEPEEKETKKHKKAEKTEEKVDQTVSSETKKEETVSEEQPVEKKKRTRKTKKVEETNETEDVEVEEKSSDEEEVETEKSEK